MTDNFTIEDQRSIQEMLDEHERLRQEIDKRSLEEIVLSKDYEDYFDYYKDYSELSENDKALVDDYSESKYFLSATRKALDFTKSSTMEVGVDSPNSNLPDIKCVSLFNNEQEYAEAIVTLTGGFDKRMMNELEATRTEPFHSVFMQKNEYDATVKAPLSNRVIEAAIKKEIGNTNVMQERTVSDIVDMIDYTKDLEEEYYINNENVIDETLSAVFEKNEAEKINVIDFEKYEKQAQQEQYEISAQQAAELYQEGYRSTDEERIQKEFIYTATQVAALCTIFKAYEENGLNEKAILEAERELKDKEFPVQIVESNDGFVMNTNKKITSENINNFNQKVENGNEVIHNEVPAETTIDTAEVRGKVKYEQKDDIGTVEKKQGIPTYEEKADADDKKKSEGKPSKKNEIER